ncbi:hypothetical protein EV702DRAFT_1116917 [Suillus placidus]|uniref:Uncharacterized protein n=1 Tax=Suillus placidus TaxID=48579 RepID=A0A9P6ZS59_9AGAM|nr:hypothetical protein EV702DRAFT_1116917 [Suillus placidus]
MTTNNTNTNTAKNESGGGFGIRSRAAQVIHGIGEEIRGTALGVADRATSSVAGVQKNADTTSKGRAEFAEGMARMKGRAPATQAPPDQGTTAGTGTGTGTSAAVAAAGVTGQGQQQGTSDEKTSAVGERAEPESTGDVVIKVRCCSTGREAAVGPGAVHEQRVSRRSGRAEAAIFEYAASQQEGKATIGTSLAGPRSAIGEQPSQQKTMGAQQEGGNMADGLGPGEVRCGQIRFQGISTDERSQTCAAQGGGHIRFQDFQGCGI